MLAGFLVVLLVEATHQLLEDCSHPMVVEARMLLTAVSIEYRVRTQVDARVKEPLDETAQCIGLRQPWNLVPKFKLLKDVLNVRRETVEVGLEVSL